MTICITVVMNNALSDGNHASGIPLKLPRLSPSPLLLVFFVIYDDGSTYDEMIILDWYVGQ